MERKQVKKYQSWAVLFCWKTKKPHISPIFIDISDTLLIVNYGISSFSATHNSLVKWHERFDMKAKSTTSHITAGVTNAQKQNFVIVSQKGQTPSTNFFVICFWLKDFHFMAGQGEEKITTRLINLQFYQTDSFLVFLSLSSCWEMPWFLVKRNVKTPQIEVFNVVVVHICLQLQPNEQFVTLWDMQERTWATSQNQQNLHGHIHFMGHISHVVRIHIWCERTLTQPWNVLFFRSRS